MTDFKSLEKALNKRGQLGVPRPGSGRFKHGVYHPERVATQFKRGSYNGYPSYEAYLEAKERNKVKIKDEKRAYRRAARTHLEIQEKVREHAEEAINVLVEIMRSGESLETTKLQAIQMLLDRGYGKASQTNINANLDADAKPSQISTTDLTKRINEAIERVERVTSGIGEAEASADKPIDIRKYN